MVPISTARRRPRLAAAPAGSPTLRTSLAAYPSIASARARHQRACASRRIGRQRVSCSGVQVSELVSRPQAEEKERSWLLTLHVREEVLVARIRALRTHHRAKNLRKYG